MPALLAHLMNTGLGPYDDGLLHLFVTPEDLLPVLALALLAGLRGPAPGRLALFCLRRAGSPENSWARAIGPLASRPLAAAALTVALGALVAADRALFPAVVAGLAIVLGVLHGVWNGSELGRAAGAIGNALGVATAIFVVVALVAAFVSTLRAPWTRIAVRVAGSWIAAAGIFMLGWTRCAAPETGAPTGPSAGTVPIFLPGEFDMVARSNAGEARCSQTPFHASSLRSVGRRDRNLRMQEEGGGPAAASHRVVVVPVVQMDVPVFEEWIGIARRLRQRRDPPADRGLPAQQLYKEGFHRQGRRPPLRDRPPPVPGRRYDQAQGHAGPAPGQLANAKATVERYTAPGRPESDQPAGARRRRDAASARRRPTSRRAQRGAREGEARPRLDEGRLADRRHRGRRQGPGRRPRQPRDGHDHRLAGRSHQGLLQPERTGVPDLVAKHGPPAKTL